MPNPANTNGPKIFIEEIDEKFNKLVTGSNCTSCECLKRDTNSLEPLIHCIIEKSPFITDSAKDATFIFVPVYTTLYNALHSEKPEISEITNSDSFKRWKGSRHINVDATSSFGSDKDFMNFKDQHVVIATNITTSFIRQNRWLNSRHIQVPTMQRFGDYHLSDEKIYNVICIGDGTGMEQRIKDLNATKVEQNSSDIIQKIAHANFTIFVPNEELGADFIYEIIRAKSVPILVSDSFLPAYAHTHIDYNKVSMRIPMNNISTLKDRIESFDLQVAKHILPNVSKVLMWPKDGIALDDNAAGVLLDYINIRHRVLKPVLRRNFLGSEEFI